MFTIFKVSRQGQIFFKSKTILLAHEYILMVLI